MYENLRQKKINNIIKIVNKFKLPDLYGFINGNLKYQTAVIMYHGINTKKDVWSIGSIDTNEFEKQIKYLKKTHKILSLKETCEIINEKKRFPKRGVVITFDDGYKDNYKNAFPILKKYKIPATIFLTTGHIGKEKIFWWNKLAHVLYYTKLKKIDLGNYGNISIPNKNNIYLFLYKIIDEFKYKNIAERDNLIEIILKQSDVEISEDINKELMASWDEIKEMSENNIDFGAHTVNHPILTNISLKQAEYEILQSKKDIEKKINKPINTFSYPNGKKRDFNSDIINILKKYGFICAVTNIPKMVSSKTNLYEIGRFSPGRDYNSFKYFISGLYYDFKYIFQYI